MSARLARDGERAQPFDAPRFLASQRHHGDPRGEAGSDPSDLCSLSGRPRSEGVQTGTAMRPDGHGGYAGYVSSFVGFAPADDPQLLVSVVLDDPKNGHFGGQVAAPVFRQVMEFALQTQRIPPTGTTAEPYPLVAPARR